MDEEGVKVSMNEQESLRQGIMLGKQAMQNQIVAMFESMKSTDKTDTSYSMANVITIDEAIQAIKNEQK
jgi:hypothetical protein